MVSSYSQESGTNHHKTAQRRQWNLSPIRRATHFQLPLELFQFVLQFGTESSHGCGRRAYAIWNGSFAFEARAPLSRRRRPVSVYVCKICSLTRPSGRNVQLLMSASDGGERSDVVVLCCLV